MATVLEGVVRGKTIELRQSSGLPDGSEVTVSVCPAKGHRSQETNSSLQRAFGGWADEADDLDKFLDWNRQQRKVSRPEPDL